MSQSETARIAAHFRRVGERIEKHADTATKAAHLAVNMEQLTIQAGRLLVNAIDAGAFPRSRASENGGWWDRSLGRLPGGPFAVYGTVGWKEGEPLPADRPEYKVDASGEFDPEQSVKVWVFGVTTWLVRVFPTRFRHQAASWSWARVARDEHGQLRGKDGRSLVGRWYKNGKPLRNGSKSPLDLLGVGKLPPGKYEWRLDGKIAHEHDFYDDADWLVHDQILAETYADACRILVELIEAGATTAGADVAAGHPSYGEILKSLAPQMPRGRPSDPEPVEPTAEVLLANADDLSALDRISAEDRKKPSWHAALRLVTEWALAYGLWIESNRPDLLSDAPSLHALLLRGPHERAGRYGRYDAAGLARDLRLIAARWTDGVQTPPQRSPSMSLERLSTALGQDPRTLKKREAARGWDLRREGKQFWSVSYARMGTADITRIDEAYWSKRTRRSKRRK